jgi:hypothetical protein
MELDYTDVEDEFVSGKGFADKFKSFQNILNVKNYSPSTSYNVNSTNIPQTLHTVQSYERRSRKSYNTRKRITPITKEKKTTERSQTTNNVTEKVRERLKTIIELVCETRTWVNKEDLYKWSIEIADNLKIIFPKSKDKISSLCIVCIILGSRIHGTYLDIHIVSMQVGETLKDTQKMLYSITPSLTSTEEFERKVLQCLIQPPRTSLLREYENIMETISIGFSKDSIILESDRQSYRTLCEKIFSSLEGDNDYDYEKQFCVTPDKVLVYGIFEIIRRKVPMVTERSICEYLSEKFSIPRVTIEKMKRLVVKYIKPDMTL